MNKKNNRRMVLETQQIPWIGLGEIAQATAAADGALGAAERDLLGADALTNTVSWKVPYGINKAEFRFLGTGNGNNQIIDIWAGRLDGDGDAELARVCSLDVETGSQDADDSTHHYADEIIVTNNDWLTTVSVIQSGNDTEFMARLLLDLCGYNVILFHGHTTFVEAISVEASGY